MKLPFTIYDLRFTICKKSAESDAANRQSSIVNHKFRRAFTLIEIALCLAIIGIALVAIIGALLTGMNPQRDSRERTIINQDSTVFMQAIRDGVRGADDLTNYVYAVVITNLSGGTGYLNPSLSSQMNFPQSVAQTIFTTVQNWNSTLTSGADIIGLMSTPELLNNNTITNHIYAYVRSISGPAVEKPPQDNGLVVGDSFSYRITCENVPVQSAGSGSYVDNLQENLHELRLTFSWPILPNGHLPARPSQQTFRTLVAGQMVQTNNGSTTFYYFQPQSFTNAP